MRVNNNESFYLHSRFLSEGELIEQQIAEQQHAQLAHQGAGSSTVISAGHMSSGGEIAGSPQRNYYMWKDSLQQPQQPGIFAAGLDLILIME